MPKKPFTTQLDTQDFETMESIRAALGMKRTDYIKYLQTMFILAYPGRAPAGKESNDTDIND